MALGSVLKFVRRALKAIDAVGVQVLRLSAVVTVAPCANGFLENGRTLARASTKGKIATASI
jgi:hypothetical protein